MTRVTSHRSATPAHITGHRTLTIELQKRIKAVEKRCYRRLLHISYKDHITNEIVCKKIQTAIGPYEDILTTVKKGNYDGSDM